MTVNVSKPVVNVREKLAELDKPTGIAGEAMLRAETPQEQFNLIGAGRRNLIINGNMLVAQRGTSFSSYSGYHIDRFKGFGHDYERIDNGDFYSLRSTYVSGTAANLYYPVELQRGQLENGQVYTLSFKYKKSGAPLNIEIFYRVGTTGSNVVQQVTPFDLDPKSEFTKFEITFTCKGRISAHTAFNIRFGNSDGVLEIADLQLELGKVATPFEHRSYGEELALCQRYYQRYTESGSSNYGPTIGYGTFNGSAGATTTEVVSVFQFPVAMRTGPDFAFSNLTHFDLEPFDHTITALETFSHSSPFFHTVKAVSSTARETGFVGFICMDSANGWFEFDAEL